VGGVRRDRFGARGIIPAPRTASVSVVEPFDRINNVQSVNVDRVDSVTRHQQRTLVGDDESLRTSSRIDVVDKNINTSASPTAVENPLATSVEGWENPAGIPAGISTAANSEINSAPLFETLARTPTTDSPGDVRLKWTTTAVDETKQEDVRMPVQAASWLKPILTDSVRQVRAPVTSVSFQVDRTSDAGIQAVQDIRRKSFLSTYLPIRGDLKSDVS